MPEQKAALSDKQHHILRHSLGLTYSENMYRNHFVTGEGSIDFPDCMALVESGMMERQRGNELTGGDDCFYVTQAGKDYCIANKPIPEKVSRSKQRYLDYLAVDSNLSFGEWLKRKSSPL